MNKALIRISVAALAGILFAAGLDISAQHLAHNAAKHSGPADNSTTALSAPALGRISRGRSAKLGNGSIHAWTAFDSDGNLAAIGVTFDEAALTGLPAEPPPGQEGTEYMLELPAEASSTVYKMAGINWNPHGHGPTKIYDIGHFDFHFYLIDEALRGKITAKGDDLAKAYKPVPAEFMPEGYIIAPDSAIPKMGSHLADPGSHEFHGKEFTKTFLYGAYNGEVIFVEPMITKAYLETKPKVTEDIKLPAKFRIPGRYPTKYSVRYDAEKKEYTVALEGMVRR